MSRIQADVAVQEQLAARGITETTGVYGDHKVQIGNGSPIRLDSIKPVRIPFAGFTRASQIEKGKEGLQNSAMGVVRSLYERKGTLDAGKLLGHLKSLQTQTDRLDKLGQLTEAQKNDTMWTFTSAVQSLSNRELSAVFQAFTSAEMDLLQTALQHEGRIKDEANDANRAAEQLFDLEAVVIKEINNRTLNEQIDATAADLSFEGLPNAPEQKPVVRPKSITEQFGQAGAVTKHSETYDMTAANLVALTEVGTGSALKREKNAMEEQVKLNSRGLDEVTVKEMGDTLRKSELTITINTEHLIGGQNNIFDNPDKPLVNIFHLHEQGLDPKGKDYLDQRDSSEKTLFPEFEGHRVNADERPVYAALNLEGKISGALSRVHGYGSSSIVLKPEVAKRSTYMLNDSFVSTPINVSQERRDNFYKLLDTANNREEKGLLGESKIPQSLINALKDVNSKEHKDLEAYFDTIQATPKFQIANAFARGNMPSSISDFFAAEQEQSGGAYERFQTLLMECFGDREATRNNMVTHDNLEALLPNMTAVDGNNLANATINSRNGEAPKAVLELATYIEAQIQGPIIPSRDIAEIRIDLTEVPNDKVAELKVQAMQYQRNTGIKVTFVDQDDHDIDESNNTELVQQQHDFNLEYFDKKGLNNIQKQYINNLADQIQEFIKNNQTLTAGLPEGALKLDGAALNLLVEKFMANCDKMVNRKEPMKNEDICQFAFKNAVKPLLEKKAELLRELEKIPLNSKQKEAVSYWVVSARALNSPEELQLVMKNAKAQAEVFMKVATAEPPLTFAQTLDLMNPLIKQMDKDVNEYANQINKKGEFGAEDKMTEFERISFMSIALAKNGEPPLDQAGIQKLAAQMSGTEMRNFLAQMPSIPNELNTIETSRLTSLLGILYRNASNINQELNLPFKKPEKFIGELSLLQETMRTFLRELTPEFAAQLDQEHPPYPTFPAPNNPGMMPKNEAERRKFLIDNLDNYKAIEEKEKYRGTHGRSHIARAYIFANVMCNILEEQGIKMDKNAVLCGIAGHDMGREGAGQDRWEKQSADMTAAAMKTAFGSDAMGDDYEQEVKNCIDKHKSPTLEGMILNAADSLDIGRVQIGAFEIDKFAFLLGKKGEVPSKKAEEIRNQLAKEANLLQCLTSPYCANLPGINQLMNYHLDFNGDLSEMFKEQEDNLLNKVETELAEDRKLDSETYMKRIEDVIHNNKQMFPLLSKYYH